MRFSSIVASAAIGLATLAVASTASASHANNYFTWTYTDPTDGYSASGAFRTTGVVNGSGQSSVISGNATITGVADAFAIDNSGSHPGFNIDNLFYPGGSQGTLLDTYGLYFSDGAGTGLNLWDNGAGNGDSLYTYNGGGYPIAADNGVFAITGASYVPEPAAWALMLLGVGGLGVALRAQRKAIAAV